MTRHPTWFYVVLASCLVLGTASLAYRQVWEPDHWELMTNARETTVFNPRTGVLCVTQNRPGSPDSGAERPDCSNPVHTALRQERGRQRILQAIQQRAPVSEARQATLAVLGGRWDSTHSGNGLPLYLEPESEEKGDDSSLTILPNRGLLPSTRTATTPSTGVGSR